MKTWQIIGQGNPLKSGRYDTLCMNGSMRSVIQNREKVFSMDANGGRWQAMDWEYVIAWRETDETTKKGS